MKKEIMDKLKEEAKKYDYNELQRYIDEIGWQDWMSEITENSELNEQNCKKIDEILKQAFKEAHENEDKDLS